MFVINGKTHTLVTIGYIFAYPFGQFGFIDEHTDTVLTEIKSELKISIRKLEKKRNDDNEEREKEERKKWQKKLAYEMLCDCARRSQARMHIHNRNGYFFHRFSFLIRSIHNHQLFDLS